MKSQFPLDDLYWLVADVNTAEIASHIEHDNLSQWCNSWRIAAKEAIQRAKQVKSEND